MGLRINTNVPSLNTQRNLRNSKLALDNSFERLSSGSRINHAQDDAAGLAISESLRAQVRSLNQAERNAQDGVSLIQVAEGAMAEIANILIRMRELSMQAASDTVGAQERQFIDIEFEELIDEMNRITNTTEYNNLPLLNGQTKTLEVQIGTRNNHLVDRIKIFDSKLAAIDSTSLGLAQIKITDKVAAQQSLEIIDHALSTVTGVRAEFGAVQNRLQSVIKNILVSRENLSAANSRIRDTDMAEETAELTKNQVLMQAGISLLGQANASSRAALSLLGGNSG